MKGLPALARTGTAGVVVASAVALAGPDYAKSRHPAVRAMAGFACHDGELCLYQDWGGQGFMLVLRVGQHVNDLATIKCRGCRGGTFDNQMTSFINKTDRVWYWYYNARGTGSQRPMGQTGNQPYNISGPDNDQASSVYWWR
ncbi:peptidase inhibitor family I36 protein [Streptoalloteichus hindustanus]|uniref:Peptidase inhibitor family I36 n=1 Tax=Streptoalloteichus hindustanus TaxID=2017 RepID=A0A1M5I4X7_STRHI|nr:peptidase inhibitor family I36 protein [Streptoalloteichus hindustanus]SHG23376.1 Peptidase inhibitor family I36 [Streptoalloteichus hindustanus]